MYPNYLSNLNHDCDNNWSIIFRKTEDNEHKKTYELEQEYPNTCAFWRN